MQRNRILSLLAAGVLIAGAGMAIACGDDDDDDNSMPNEVVTSAAGGTSVTGAATVVTGAVGTSAAGATGGKLTERTITAKDYSYDFPDRIDGGLIQFKLDNQGKQTHQAQIARINDGVSAATFDAAAKDPDPAGMLALVSLAGGPNAVKAGKSQTVVDNLMQPGQYVLLCFVSDDGDNVLHTAKGMVKKFEVTAPAATQPAPPEAKATVTLSDYSFAGTETITSGKMTINVKNSGPQPHEAGILRLTNGFTAEQLLGVFAGSGPAPAGPPPIEEAGGIVALANGAQGWMDIDLPAGNYAFICFIPDAASGAPHAALGMVKGFTIK